MAARATTLLASALLWTGRAGHGAMLIPGPPRNAIDGKSHPWSGEVPSVDILNPIAIRVIFIPEIRLPL
jgi:hypothetical protein